MELTQIKSRIRKALKQRGDYSKDMEFIIDSTAGIYIAYSIALHDIEELSKSDGKCYVIETTREGNTKQSLHVAFEAMLKTSEALRRNFRELKLTLATVEAGVDDEMNELINKVNDIK